MEWDKLEPITPFYLFAPQDQSAWASYAEGKSITAIFTASSVGIVTARDSLTIQFEKDLMWRTVRRFLELEGGRGREEFELGDDVQDWKVEWAQEDVNSSGPDETLVVPILYRLFDRRWTYFTGNSRGFICRPRGEVMNHMLHDNIGLMTCRQVPSGTWQHTFVTDSLVDDSLVSNKTRERGYLYPLYRYKAEKTENLSPDFRAFIDARYADHHYTPEDVLGYIYAVLHSPTYRTRYAEFLRIDFPRVPFPEKSADFEALSDLGWDFMQKHLLRHLPELSLGKYQGQGDNSVKKPHYVEAEQALYIAAPRNSPPCRPRCGSSALAAIRCWRSI